MTGSGKTTTGNDAGGLDAARFPATSRRRAYTAALRAARALAGFGPTGILRSSDVDPDPETIERYRQLLIAVAVARGGSDGAAVVAVLRRGYLVVPGATAGGKLPKHVYPITTRAPSGSAPAFRVRVRRGAPSQGAPGRSTPPHCPGSTSFRRMCRWRSIGSSGGRGTISAEAGSSLPRTRAGTSSARAWTDP